MKKQKLYIVVYNYSDSENNEWGCERPTFCSTAEEARTVARSWVKKHSDMVKAHHKELGKKYFFINESLYPNSVDFYAAIVANGFDYENDDDYIYVLLDEAESGSVCLYRMGHGVEDHWEANIHEAEIEVQGA